MSNEEKMEDDWEYYDDNSILPDFWQAFVTDDKSFHSPVEYWLKYFSKPYENPYGWNMYREFWRVWVPLLLAPRHGTSSVDQPSEMEENKVTEVLINSLEQFICGQTNVTQVFKSLSDQDVPADVCGHVFRSGETCYNCRDCGQDATCVLCVDCFTHSEHKNHKYRMSTSEGGGYCDCGDLEAFTSFPSCSLHTKEEGTDKQTAAQVLEKFPEDLKERARDVLYNVCKYCIDIVSNPKGQLELVSGAKEKELFPDLKFPLQFSNYCCVLMNDENHSYNDVIRVLNKVLNKPSPKLAMDLTTYVDKHGKAVVKVGSYQECFSVSQKIEGLTRISNPTVLKSSVWSTHIVAHEAFVTRLLEWLPKLFSVSSGFRALFSEVMFMNNPKTNVSLARNETTNSYPLAEAVLLNDAKSWKKVRGLWLSLLVDGIMKDYDSKKDLAVLFAKNYTNIVEDFITDDQERESSIMSLSVQIFTVPSLAIHLIEKVGALTNLLQGFYNLLTSNMTDENKIDLTAWQNEEKSEFQRGVSSLHDLTYLLGVAPGPDQWTDELRKQFKNGVDLVLKVLLFMQGSDSMKRQVGQHLEMEDNIWKLTYELTTYFGNIVRLVTNWAKSDRIVLVHLIHECLRLLVVHQESDPPVQMMTKYLAFLGPPKSFHVTDYDVSKQSVSLHVPIHRLLVKLLVETGRYDLETTLRQRIEDNIIITKIIEPVLQTVAAVSQMNIGMWRRNGTMAESQAFLYNSRKYCPGLREADMLLLQICLALSEDVDQLLVTFLARFKLAKWATGDLDSETAIRNEEFVEHCNGLAEQWLNLIIALTGERVVPGVGQGVGPRETLRREVLHLLCIEPLAHSSVMKKLPDSLNLEKEADEVLADVADLKSSPQTAGKKMYYLKPGLEKEYSIFYHSYTKEQQTAALEAQLTSTKSSCPPPPLPHLTKLCGGLVRVLKSPVILQACVVTLRRSTDTSSNPSKYWTEGQVHKVLFLLALGVREQETEGDRCGWVRSAESSGVFSLIQKVVECQKLPEHLRQLASWILQQTRAEGEPMEVVEEPKEEIEAEKEKKRRAEMAAARKAKILAQMNKAQKNFAAENKGALEDLTKEGDKEKTKSEGAGGSSLARQTVCLGPGQTERSVTLQTYTCILCQEDGNVGSGSALVMASYILKSTVLSQKSVCDEDDMPPAVSPHHLPVDKGCGPHLSTCGHAMHAPCYQKFFDSLVVKERDRAINLMTQKMNFDVSSGEFLCPLCERLSNTVLPLIPAVSELRKKQTNTPPVELSLASLVSGLQSSLQTAYLKEDKENGPSLMRIALNTSLEDQATQQGTQFAQCFLPSRESDCSPFEESITSMMNVFSVACFTTSLELPPFEEDYRVPLICLQAATLTLHNLEQGLSRDEKPLFGSLNPRDEDAIRYITRFIATFPSSYSKPSGSAINRVFMNKMKNFYKLKSLQSNAVYLLCSLLGSGPSDAIGDPLQLDSLGVLVSLLVSLPCLYESELPPRLPSGQGLELHCLKLSLVLHTVQVLSSMTVEDYPRSQGAITIPSPTISLIKWSLQKQSTAMDPSTVNIPKLYTRLETLVLPFLRCSALLFQHFSDIVPGTELVQDGGRSYSPLARYLGLPSSLQQLIESPASKTLLAGLTRTKIESQIVPKFPLSYRRVVPPTARPFYPLADLAANTPSWTGGLIPLPRVYADLMNMTATFVCKNSVTGESKTPALCLVCGVLVCSQSHCCETVIGGEKCGGCTSHARICGASNGIFLRIRECVVFLQSKVHRGTFLPAPYLDDYGEPDKGLKRGNPLYLDQQKYDELNRIWLKNEVPEKIARAYDPDILILVDWNNL